MNFDYDLYVLGAGSGGVRASRMAAARGARVAVAEHDRLGGTCVNLGCIPKKLMVYASALPDACADGVGYGFEAVTPRHNWRSLIEAKDRELQRLNGIYKRMLEQAGVDIHHGQARLVDAHTVETEGKRFRAKHILIAVGGWPSLPDFPGAELVSSSNEMFALPERPGRIAVIGGGYIALEFAGVFHGLGSKVHLLYRGEQVLRGFDDDIRNHLHDELCNRGMDVRTRTQPTRIDSTPDGLRITLENGEVLEVDQVLAATGRSPRTAGLGLEQAGVKLDERGAVVVDAFGQSSVPGIHAVGDVTDRINLTPVALHEAMAIVRTLFDGVPTRPDHRDVPSAVFSQPEVATVGLGEAQARAAGHDLRIYRSRFRPLRHTLSGREEKALMKLVVDAASDRVLGVHVVAEHAAEMVQGFAVALKCGATKAQFDATLGIHPTAAEELVTMRTAVED